VKAKHQKVAVKSEKETKDKKGKRQLQHS